MRSEFSGSTAVLEADETVQTADTLVLDTHVGAESQKAGHIQNGYGACSASGCNCQAYSGSAYTCANCGHNYATHW